jgi:hypothetical protein
MDPFRSDPQPCFEFNILRRRMKGILNGVATRYGLYKLCWYVPITLKVYLGYFHILKIAWIEGYIF